MSSKPIHDSAKVYTPFLLRLYDFVVLWLSNRYAWRCSTGDVLLPFFKAHVGSQAHLDIGVGTGYYPSNAVGTLSNTKIVSLADLNPHTLQLAETRLRGAGYKGDLRTAEHDVFQPLPQSLGTQFDSISLFYLFHCLPGAFPEKGTDVLSRLAPVLARDGTLYGATILGKGVSHNWFGRRLMGLYNKKGIFGNTEDSVEGLTEALKHYFEEVDVKVIATVALFVAKRPRVVPAELKDGLPN
ncbi:hypothetical protein NM688_g2177 [Phlebia brevispora]|uniref:Uncharacterized protein n=1 Tax=Phlebia brevispora TaxID=194682 RepID=A0ACC1T980_9APHY|nr:hypothetical protein NM688_g2177 [Phlebia brevispora]